MLLAVLLPFKMLVLNLICYFSSHYLLDSILLPDNIVLNVTNKDQSFWFLDCHWCCSHVTLETQHLTSHKVCNYWYFNSLPGAEGDVIQSLKFMTCFQKYMELWIWKYLNGLIMWLVYYYFFSTLHAGSIEIWTLQCSFLYTVKDTVSPGEAHLYVKWNLVKVQKQPSSGLPWSAGSNQDGTLLDRIHIINGTLISHA